MTKIIDILDSNKEVGEAKLAESIFNVEPKLAVIKSVILWQLAKRRSGNHKAKVISEVSGTTAKPFKQKGTGNARQGSKRSPQFRGGATIFGPVVRSHAFKLNKKIRKLGLVSALSLKLKEDKLILISDPKLDKPSTKIVNNILGKLGTPKPIFLTSKDSCPNFLRSVANIPAANSLDIDGLNVYDLIKSDIVYITESGLKKLTERLA
jgi:large subunit ribosomal protein L4